MAGPHQHDYADKVSTGAFEETLVVPHSLKAPRLARQWLADHVADLPSGVVDDAVLLTSELVANAVLHGLPDVQVSVRVTPRMVRVAVADRDPTPPVVPDELLSPSRASGRGLFIVAALAAAWGVDLYRVPPGKSVWFTLDFA